MTGVEKIINIENKRKKYNFLFILNILVSMGFTLAGTVSIISLLMYLYEFYNISFWGCLILDLILPSIYSFVVNTLIKPIDKLAKNTLVELNRLAEEYNKELEQSKKEIFIKNVEFRFQNLSIENQRKLLNYVKDNCLVQSNYNDIMGQWNISGEEIIKREIDDTQMLIQDNGYSRRKIKHDDNK